MAVVVDCQVGETPEILFESLNDSVGWEMNESIDDIFVFTLELTKKAGKMVRRAFNKRKCINTKQTGQDLVTETDEAVERMLISTLKTRFPTHRFIGEESIAGGKKCELTERPTWIIDPIDGTNNFIVMGIVYNPIQEKLYSAKKGQGAYCNSEEISVSGQTELKKALVFSEFGSHREPKKLEIKFGNMYNIIMKSHGIRAQGSAALDLCGVACGQADAFVEYGIHVWDIAAGILIATEAGATVMDPNNGGKLDMMNRRILCASSRSLAHQLRSQIKSQEFIPD
ncbi:inositol monophosphatase 2 [Octopus bimaculoides]|uniref:Inositol-1-monophosphatase n=1 Tax=Octopus bimaculoides TaxID=37653 RepID=A0A0L8GGH6_OCTBM|nr:inositol monophosphatase 2 [Octopus bimaculoides]|eukprot:XP_014781338.1 PREDICTED: inositol monophosphatase 2-like [Octopus bimaculoides]